MRRRPAAVDRRDHSRLGSPIGSCRAAIAARDRSFLRGRLASVSCERRTSLTDDEDPWRRGAPRPLAYPKQRRAPTGGAFQERMMGLEPTTFCTASGSRVESFLGSNPHQQRDCAPRRGALVCSPIGAIGADSGGFGHKPGLRAQTLPPRSTLTKAPLVLGRLVCPCAPAVVTRIPNGPPERHTNVSGARRRAPRSYERPFRPAPDVRG